MSQQSQFGGGSDFQNPSVDENETPVSERAVEVYETAKNAVFSRPLTTLLVGAGVGIALGAVLWKSTRRRSPLTDRLGALERSYDLARSGTVKSVQNFRKTLRSEGYSLSQLDGRTLKKHLNWAIAEARRYGW